MRIIGDVHNKIAQYNQIASESEYSVQVGDVGFGQDYKKITLDPNFHRVCGGNHDSYAKDEHGNFFEQTPHFLGDFGEYTLGGFKFFFVRGGCSIDKEYRIPGVSWWEDEQLSYGRLMECLDLYTKVKPEFVISHECPSSIIPYISHFGTWNGQKIKPSMTAHTLECMFQAHQPNTWVFGHHHVNKTVKLDKIEFICLPELGYKDF